MPDIRYALKNHDRTTTGGVLIATTVGMWDHSTPVGVEGDFATCPACKEGGPVFNDCNPSFDVLGKQILVSGARVYCKCVKQPLVIASQSMFTIEVNLGGGQDRAVNFGKRAREMAALMRDGGGLSGHADRYAMIDRTTGNPIANAAYAIRRASGALEHGTTDAAGHTHLLSTHAQAEVVEIYLED